jgi:hypothetical protein
MLFVIRLPDAALDKACIAGGTQSFGQYDPVKRTVIIISRINIDRKAATDFGAFSGKSSTSISPKPVTIKTCGFL